MNEGAQCGESRPLFVGNVDRGSPGPVSPSLTAGDRNFRRSANGKRQQLLPAWGGPGYCLQSFLGRWSLGGQGPGCSSSEEGFSKHSRVLQGKCKKANSSPLKCNFKKSYSTLPRNGGT